MKKKQQQLFYVPSTNSTKYEFLVVGASDPITIIREEQWFYQLEQDNKKKPLGNLVSTCKYLYSCQAEWLTKEARRKRMFYNRETAVQMLREGYTVVHIESGNRISYTADYSRIVCSSSIVLENDVPPGNYCISVVDTKIPRTMKEVVSERKEKLRKAAEEVDRKKKAEARKAEITKLEKQQQEQRNCSTTISQPETATKDNKTLWGYIFTGAACLVTGVVATRAYLLNR